MDFRDTEALRGAAQWNGGQKRMSTADTHALRHLPQVAGVQRASLGSLVCCPQWTAWDRADAAAD